MTKKEILENYEPIPYSGCWIWKSSVTPKGYGHLEYEGRTRRAHRVMYTFFKGPIPEGMLVCHTCDVRSCVNPEHLFTGTYADNIRDAVMKGRVATGERNGISILTEKKVQRIRKLLAKGVSQRKIAAMFGVDQSTICAINTGRTWNGGGSGDDDTC